MDDFSIMDVNLNLYEITHLIEESLADGHRHIQRLAQEYKSGENMFSERGEALKAAVHGGKIVGICGLNRDPYSKDEDIGRVRRLYVLKGYRRHGVGKGLMETVVEEAGKHYKVILLFTDNPAANQFYKNWGSQINQHMKNPPTI